MRRHDDTRLVVLGMMGRTPFAGVAWQVLQYLEGFSRLGYDVFYVEDTGEWPYDADKNTVTDDCTYTVNYIARLMSWCDMPNRWAFRSAVDGQVYGMDVGALSDLFSRADVLVNLTGATILQEEHLRVPVRIYLETDPVLPQFEVAQGRQFTIDLLAAHTHHFTYGENIGTPHCPIPTGMFQYGPTRQPIILEWWEAGDRSRDAAGSDCFTTLGSWQQSGKDLKWDGETYYWSKHHEFLKFVDLPKHTPQCLELALACDDEQALATLRSNGWRVVDAIPLSRDILPYRDYIRSSRGELTVAKDQNIRLRSGWFSDRSASYLAGGKPVITQDTAFGHSLPVGQGLFAFESTDDILAALETINADYSRQSQAARCTAYDCFRAEYVLTKLLSSVGL